MNLRKVIRLLATDIVCYLRRIQTKLRAFCILIRVERKMARGEVLMMSMMSTVDSLGDMSKAKKRGVYL